MKLTRSTLAAASALSLALAGCSKGGSDGNGADMAPPALPATLPMTTGPATTPAYAPAAAALPARRIATVRVTDPRQDYAYADQAADYADALEDAPPDYGFNYDGVEPWAWQDANGYRQFAEPIDGGYRYYYFRPGADTPFFVRDPDYGYGYDGTRLAVIYTLAGAILPFADYGPRLGYGGAYWSRGQALYRASLDNERRAVIAANWAARSAAIAQSRANWIAARQRDADWRAYHAAQAGRGQGFWTGEETRRQADAQRFADWHHDDFRGPPPPRAIPARWQSAPWAQNRAAYLPVARAGAPDRDRPPAAQPRASGPSGPAQPPSPDHAGPIAGPAQRSPQAQPGRPEPMRGQPAAGRPAGQPNRGPDQPGHAPRGADRQPGPPNASSRSGPPPHSGPSREQGPRAPAADAAPRGEPRVAVHRSSPDRAAPPSRAMPSARPDAGIHGSPQPRSAPRAEPQSRPAAEPRAAPQSRPAAAPHAAPQPHAAPPPHAAAPAHPPHEQH